MSAEAPEWIDASLVQKALRQEGQIADGVRVDAISVCIGTNPGDNYGSALYRLEATLSDGGRRSLLVKTLPLGEQMVVAIQESDVFATERDMLVKWMPRINELLQRAGHAAGAGPTAAALAARCPHAGTSPSPHLVLEDLKPQGFRMAVKQRGLGLRHALLAIRSLARLHAASAALIAENPSMTKEFSNFFKSNGEKWKGFFSSTVQMSADACRKIPGFDEYVDILERFKDKAVDVYAELNDPKPNRFNVIVHGDFWVNNMMFKYDENGRPIDFRMVDFQLSHVASPAVDLISFLTGSMSEEVFIEHEGLLLREYHWLLSETLQRLGLQGPTFRELKDDLDAHSAYCMFGALCAWPFSKAESVLDVEGALGGDCSNNAAPFQTLRMRAWLAHVLPEFKRRGWLPE